MFICINTNFYVIIIQKKYKLLHKTNPRTNMTLLVNDDENDLRVALKDGSYNVLNINKEEITAVLLKQVIVC